MLFALDWIEGVRSGLAGFLMSLLNSLNFNVLSQMFTEGTFLTVMAYALSFVLCLYGFKYHRAVHGIWGAIILGSFGWYLGIAANPDTVAIAWVYAVMMVLVGYFAIYICYSLNVFIMTFLFSICLGAPFRSAFLGTEVFFALLLSIVACIMYAKFKPVMTAIYGGLFLGILFYQTSPYLALAVAAASVALGILVQEKLLKIYRIRRAKELDEEIRKYPYGPGIAYGWEDPTIRTAGNDT